MIDGILDWLWHLVSRCRRCRLLSTPDGIGGQCVSCGRIHGWVTRDELIRYSERMP